jgi:protein SMG5
MALKVFSDWLSEHPLALATCAQGSPSVWSRLASLLNLLPPAEEIIAAGLRSTLPPGMEWSQTHALHEDTLLRGFAPLVNTHQQLQFEATSSPDMLEQACNRICVLQKFGRHVSRTKATVLFQWDGSVGRFLAPLQREREEERAVAGVQGQQREKAAENRSKLMKAMAERRLQVEVASLAETSAQQEATVFTPYLLPDAQSLCTGLHLVRKLIASEKFIVIIAKSVIDSLDGMKKGRENYAAREAIKFLERSLQGGGKMVRVQGADETLQPGRKKPPKMDLNTWRYSGLVDCALYFTHTFAERGSSYQAATTLLVDQSLAKLVEGGSEGGEGVAQLATVLSEAQLNGVPIDTVVRFHGKWKQSQSSLPSSHRHKTSDRR